MSELSEIKPGPAARPPSKQPTSLETARSVARRLDRSVRTIDRWCELGILPEPVRIRGKRFWPGGVMPKPDAPDAT
jgi:hypothetical protein